ncbi:unnamed protein product [Caenorhabditis brenneri]
MGNCIFGNRGSDTRNIDSESIPEITLGNGPSESEPLSMEVLEPIRTIESFEEKISKIERIVYKQTVDVLPRDEYVFAFFRIWHTMLSELFSLFDCDSTAPGGDPMHDGDPMQGDPMQGEDALWKELAELQSFHMSIGNYDSNPAAFDINEWYRAVFLQRTILEELKKIPKFAK